LLVGRLGALGGAVEGSGEGSSPAGAGFARPGGCKDDAIRNAPQGLKPSTRAKKTPEVQAPWELVRIPAERPTGSATIQAETRS